MTDVDLDELERLADDTKRLGDQRIGSGTRGDYDAAAERFAIRFDYDVALALIARLRAAETQRDEAVAVVREFAAITADGYASLGMRKQARACLALLDGGDSTVRVMQQEEGE